MDLTFIKGFAIGYASMGKTAIAEIQFAGKWSALTKLYSVQLSCKSMSYNFILVIIYEIRLYFPRFRSIGE